MNQLPKDLRFMILDLLDPDSLSRTIEVLEPKIIKGGRKKSPYNDYLEAKIDVQSSSYFKKLKGLNFNTLKLYRLWSLIQQHRESGVFIFITDYCNLEEYKIIASIFTIPHLFDLFIKGELEGYVDKLLDGVKKGKTFNHKVDAIFELETSWVPRELKETIIEKMIGHAIKRKELIIFLLSYKYPNWKLSDFGNVLKNN